MLDAPVEAPAKAPDMLHWLHHFESDGVAVAYCGFRKVPDELSFGPTVDCVVCESLKAGE